MAHNHLVDFAPLYRSKTIGQLLLLDDNLLEYVLLTSPMGSGDGGKKGSSTSGARTPRGKYSDIYDAHNLAAKINRANPGAMQIVRTTKEAYVRGKPWLAQYLRDEAAKDQKGGHGNG
jgi:hypothetical protein